MGLCFRGFEIQYLIFTILFLYGFYIKLIKTKIINIIL